MIRLEQGRYITVPEYAKQAGISTQAVYNAIWQGRLKAYKPGTEWLIKADALIVNRTIRSGHYIGVRALLRGDIEEFARKRKLHIDTDDME
jgi:excisionase family DNA binding protein